MNLFVSSNPRTCSEVVFPPLGDSDVVAFFIDFRSNLKGDDAPFYRKSYDHFCADRDGLCDHLRDVPWEDIFKLSSSAAAATE